MKPLCLFVLLLTPLLARADQERYVTLTIPAPSLYGTTNQWNGPLNYYGATNTLQIPEGEVAEVVTLTLYNPGGIYSSFARVQRDQAVVTCYDGMIVVGPASFTIAEFYSNREIDPNAQGGILTVKLTPQTAAAQQSVVVAPGMGNVQITLESSTNLLTWASATNGVYSDDLRFFRVKLTKLN